MRSFAPGLSTLAAVIFFTAAIAQLFGAEPQLPPSKRNAPKRETIEFSTSTSPTLPKPTTRVEELQNRPSLGSQNEGGANMGPAPASIAPVPQPAQMNKALAERMLQDLDRRKNWMVPGAQDTDLHSVMGDWMSKGFEQNTPSGEKKNESVMERFLKGNDTKSRTHRNPGSKESDSPFGDRKTDNELDQNRSLFDPRTKDNEAKGISDFNLQGVLSSGIRTDFGRTELKALEGFRSEYGQDADRSLRNKELAREREVLRSAEFQKLIQPRDPSMSPVFSGIPDPINSPDLTRRDLNPILPRASEPLRTESTPFGAPPGGGFRRTDSGMFGVATPASPAFAPTPPPAPQISVTPGYKPSMSIILEAPKRQF
jgi:hypothetical protein